MTGGVSSRDRIRAASLVLVLSLVLACSARAQAQQQSNSSQAPPAQPSAEPAAPVSPPEATIERTSTKPEGLLLPESTPVKLKLLHSLNSKTVVEGDPLNFAVAEDVSVNGTTVVKVGTVAIGRVRKAKPARTLGRGAQLMLEMQYVRVGRVRVPLRGSQARTGDNKKGDTVALVALFGLSGLIKHGSEIEVKEGSIFTAYVAEDTELQPELEAEAQVQ